jgi:hypothetical protein
MEPIVLVLVLAAALLPVIALARLAETRNRVNELRSRLGDLEAQVRILRRETAAPASPARAEAPVAERPPPLPAPATVRRPIPKMAAPVEAAPPPLSDPAGPRETPAPAEPPAPDVGWEEFMGAKLFAWIGGLALFLGIAFFVKYSFDHNLAPPEARVAIGFAAGLALLLVGDLTKRKENAVTAQTLSATGTVVLYAVTYACRSYYHFAFFGVVPTFVVMALITGVAFLLSVRMNALVVAVLGVAGGFLTPVFISTGQDYPLGLFGYIALLDIGLLCIAQRQRWKILQALGAAGTLITQVSWLAAFFVADRYFDVNNVLVPMAVLAGFQFLFFAAAWWAIRADRQDDSAAGPALLMGCVAVAAAFYFLAFPTLGHRPFLLCGYLFLADIGLIGLSVIAERLAAVRMPVGLAAFLFLGTWTEMHLTDNYLVAALSCTFVFALLHSLLPLALRRFKKSPEPVWRQLFPICSLALVLIPIFQFNDYSLLIWPFALLIDALAFLVAVATGALAPLLIALALTLAAIGGALAGVPADLTGLPAGLCLLAGCSFFFITAGSWAARRLMPREAAPGDLLGSPADLENLALQLPALSAILPFLLLIMVMTRLPLHDPSPVFGLALVLIVLLLAMARVLSLDGLPVVGLVCILALEHTWMASQYFFGRTRLSLDWFLLFYGVFTLFPFLFRRRFAETKAPWAASALAGPLHFYLVYEAVKAVFPAMQPGLLPAMFAVPSLAGLVLLARSHPAANPARNTQLAFHGGAVLFFITLIFPLQFHREWITISWALEGAALCWLFRKIPHPGLRLVGFGLLVVAFARLGLNPLVLSYHARAAHPFFNWYLYAYAVVSMALFAGAILLSGRRNLAGGMDLPPLLYTMGTVLAFLLVNIEIADFFSAPGAPVLTFEFSGNFARDMSYSIAWALFALLLLVIGIARRSAPVRYAAIGLLSAAILKLFLHDLSELDQLYRIAAFIAVSVIAILASFLYQRFFAFQTRAQEPR